MIARAQDGTLLAARLLLAAALLPTGIARALNVSGFALTLAGNGMPFPNGVATAAVVVQVFGPLALILGVLPRLTGLALAVFATITAFVIHPFWHYVGPAAVAERTLMLADLGLAGGFLIYGLSGPGAWSWQGWRAGALAPAPSAKPAAAKPSGKNAAAKGGTKRPAGRAPARAAA
ncbi:DoxX family protein [Methylobacterium sp. A49B]|jgi:putative oxidoreductase|uniref:DoxX family protein n=1 Tax=Methylobacterium mesophilicum SR1.6/6 TaxID=908290 RepID=A0A6B9FG61_9HYPH|nr:DoxX family protein [Methylobacterium mesophilicum]MBE7249538.1 DoxX family protein [Actinomycetospora chiangmaiensis]QGY01760.1 DoxX family protein [Methylobacterium mesophilicum SR1.6/6]